MTRSLVDVNVWLAPLVIQHEHHPVALRWFNDLAPSEAHMCRFVQLGLMRLLANTTVMTSYAVAPRDSWNFIAALLEDERVEYIEEPKELDTVLPPLLQYPIPTGKLIADAYLAAFAMKAGTRLVSLDSSFRQFRNLGVHLLDG